MRLVHEKTYHYYYASGNRVNIDHDSRFAINATSHTTDSDTRFAINASGVDIDHATQFIVQEDEDFTN